MLEAQDSNPQAIIDDEAGKEAESGKEFSMGDHEDFANDRFGKLKEKIWPVLGILTATVATGLSLNELVGFVPLEQIGINLDTTQVSVLALLMITGSNALTGIGARMREKREMAQSQEEGVTNG